MGQSTTLSYIVLSTRHLLYNFEAFLPSRQLICSYQITKQRWCVDCCSHTNRNLPGNKARIWDSNNCATQFYILDSKTSRTRTCSITKSSGCLFTYWCSLEVSKLSILFLVPRPTTALNDRPVHYINQVRIHLPLSLSIRCNYALQAERKRFNLKYISPSKSKPRKSSRAEEYL